MENNTSSYQTFLSQNEFLKNQVSNLIYKDLCYQSDATLLYDVTNKIQLYYMTYLFMVQDRVFTVEGYWYFGCCHFLFDSLREKKSVPLTKESSIACFKNSYGTPFEKCCITVTTCPISPQFLKALPRRGGLNLWVRFRKGWVFQAYHTLDVNSWSSITKHSQPSPA